MSLSGAQRRPLIFEVEDLHWCDKTSEDYLASLVESLAGASILLLTTYRPGYHPPWIEKSYATQISLHSLTAQDALHVVHSTRQDTPLADEVALTIVAKAEGNPFFLEEFTRTVIERGDFRDPLTVPDTIQGVLSARIDRLAEASKRLLQTAAVLGREFSPRLLAMIWDEPEMVDALLSDLKRREFLLERTGAEEPVYAFTHALTQEVAYASLLTARRQSLHAASGQALERLYADRLSDQSEMVAYHFVKGEDWVKALDYLLKAAEKATRMYAIREAMAYYDQALEATGHQGRATSLNTIMTIHQAKAHLYFLLSDYSRCRDENEHLLTLARQAGDRAGEGTARAGMGLASLWAHDLEQALLDTQQALEIAEAMDDKPVLAACHSNLGKVYAVTGQLDQARQELDQALTLSRASGHTVYELSSLHTAGGVRYWEGAFADASRPLLEAISMAQEHNRLASLLSNLWVYGLTLTGQGHYDEAHTIFAQGLERAEQVEAEVMRLRFLNSLGWLFSECGALDRSLHYNQLSAQDAHKRGNPEILADAELNRADCWLAQGDLEQTQELLGGVYRTVHNPATSAWMKWRYSMHLFCSLGELWLARGEPTKAEEFADQCLDLATRTTSRKYLVRGWRLKGESALAYCQWDETHRWLHQALTLAHEVGNPTQLWKTYVALGHFHRTVKRPEQARQGYHAARVVIDRIKGNLQSAELRACLEGSPLMQQVYDLSPSE
jgi:tetratricopeptide (TPR) repeat protein